MGLLLAYMPHSGLHKECSDAWACVHETAHLVVTERGWAFAFAADGNADDIRAKTYADHQLAALVRMHQLRSATRSVGFTFPSQHLVVSAAKAATLEETLGVVLRGIVVEELRPDGPAARAGMREGAVLVGLNGHSIRVFEDVARMFRGAGRSIRAAFSTGGGLAIDFLLMCPRAWSVLRPAGLNDCSESTQVKHHDL